MNVLIFVKQVPLNEIEGKPQNIQSTANLFYLPLYYQYGVGSGGFSVWRELSAHAMTTGCVLAKESQNFPLMYHWRILDSFQEKKPFDEDEFNNHVTYWENSLEIGQRVKANQQALSNVVIFIGLCSDIRPVTSQQPEPVSKNWTGDLVTKICYNQQIIRRLYEAKAVRFGTQKKDCY